MGKAPTKILSLMLVDVDARAVFKGENFLFVVLVWSCFSLCFSIVKNEEMNVSRITRHNPELFENESPFFWGDPCGLPCFGFG